MKISFLNEQNKFKITNDIKTLVKKCALSSLKHMDFRTDVEISVVFCDNEGIRELNNMHRGIDRETDVLSFPMFEYDENGDIIDDIDEFGEFNEFGELCLGDIVISLEKANQQAIEYGHSFEREVGFLTVHSMLHLLGFDHMEKTEEEEMFKYQEEILEKIKLRRNI